MTLLEQAKVSCKKLSITQLQELKKEFDKEGEVILECVRTA